jgi:hypothetical protein
MHGTKCQAVKKVNLITADSDKRFVAELQEAIDEEWSPVWESFRAAVVGESRQKVIYNILLKKENGQD